MFDRFSDHARKSMGLARQASLRFSSDHIGPVHMLLGLLEDARCTAVRILAELDVYPEALAGDVQAQLSFGGSGVTMAQLPFTAEAKRVLQQSLAEAMSLGDRGIGTEHLLIALCCIDEGPVAHAFRKYDLRHEVLVDALQRVDASVGRTWHSESAEDLLAAAHERIALLEEHAMSMLKDLRSVRTMLAKLES